jgi:signal transduction histidine kinase
VLRTPSQNDVAATATTATMAIAVKLMKMKVSGFMRAASSTSPAPESARTLSRLRRTRSRLPGKNVHVSTESKQLDRLKVLVNAGIALSSELSLDALLQRIVETAAEITGARYAALGVIDKSGQALERFLTTGVDARTHAAIGELPHGRGILGVLIRDAQPLRLRNIADDPRSAGLPPNHPPMKSFLGLPIMLRGVAYGNLYLTEKEDGQEFTEEDEELTQLLAAQAAVAIENARLYESSTRWLRQVESLNEIGSALASELELEPLLELVARRLQELVEAKLVLIALPDAGALRIAAAQGESAYGVTGMELAVGGSKAGRVLERGRSERIDSLLDDPEVDHQATRQLGVHSALYVPLLVRGLPIGVLIAHDKQGPRPAFREEDLRLAESLAARAAVAVDLSQRIGRDSFRRVVEAQELERARLARELHDETGQALTSILLGLKPLEQAATSDEARAAVADVRELVVSTLQSVRRLAVELRPSALDHFGLEAAVERLAETFREQSGLAVDLETQVGSERLTSEAETTLYRVIQEGLTNIVKHAGATRVSILLQRKDTTVVAVIEDDGAGFDPSTTREDALGLAGMRERVSLAGGRLQVESTPGSGTTLVAEVPAK